MVDSARVLYEAEMIPGVLLGHERYAEAAQHHRQNQPLEPRKANVDTGPLREKQAQEEQSRGSQYFQADMPYQPQRQPDSGPPVERGDGDERFRIAEQNQNKPGAGISGPGQGNPIAQT